MKKNLNLLLMLAVTIVGLYFFKSNQKKNCSFTMSPQFSGTLQLLKERSPLESGIVRLNDNLYFILTYMTGPDSNYSSTPVFLYPVKEDGRIGNDFFNFGETEHVRQITKLRTPWGEGVLLADHGKDGGDFPGGKILLIVKDKMDGKLIDKSALLNQGRNFSFNAVAIRNNSHAQFDDILITPFNGPKSKVVYLKASRDGYSDASELLPDSWRKFQQCFMTAEPIDVNHDGVDEIALGACDQNSKDKPSAEDKLLVMKNGRWEFDKAQTFPARKREPTWGTVNWLKDDDKLFALTHNKGFTKSDLQYFTYDNNQSRFKEHPVRLINREAQPNYLHKMIRFGDKYFVLIRYLKPSASLNVMALAPDAYGDLNEQTVCLQGENESAVLGMDTFVNKAGKEHMVILYYSGKYQIY